MPDNLDITPGTGRTIGTDLVGGVDYQRVKVVWGPDGTVNDADVATGKPMPVQLRSSTGTDLIGTAGTASAAVVTVQGIASGTALTASLKDATAGTLVKAEDAAAVSGDLGVMVLGVRRDTPASSSTTDGDYSTFNFDANGSLYTTATLSGSITVSSSAGDVAHDGVDSGNPIKVGGYAKAAAPSDVSADGDRVNAWFLRNGAQSVNLTAAGALIPGDATTGLSVGGAVAHDGADSGKPLKIGARARSSEIAAVSSDDRSDLLTDLVGKLIVLPYANPENFVSGAITTAMTGTTTTSLLAAPASGLRNYITQITVSCAHATQGTDVIIQDGSGGTTLYTIPAAALYGGATVTFPTPLRQPTTATAIYCANVTTGSSTKVSASGYKGA